LSEVEIAEITKIAENAHRYLQIAFADPDPWSLI
jgi:UDP-N-acetyl-D-mannosaminuronate dehydrogenase